VPVELVVAMKHRRASGAAYW